MSEPTSYDPYAMPPDAIQEPPKSLWKALRKIGPGIILAGSIIGTGELLLTTSLGAKWGFVFLWLILFSCVVKVFVQIELGRYAISSGKPTLGALNELPGPRLGAHWLVWWWFAMMLCTITQLGGMVGGVGQALDLAFPKFSPALAEALSGPLPALAQFIDGHRAHPWAVLTALTAVVLLLSGGYRSIERITTLLVAGVTAVTVLCVAALPAAGYPITGEDIKQGFNVLALPVAALGAAFATFGITGVGASELYSYPYWCLEKGYARFAGPCDASDGWVRRARGWMRVLQLDAWVSMVVFTVATVAFYCMGATVLHRQNLVPDETQMMGTLSKMYVPALGEWTMIGFLIGAWAVLFKTLYVASASNSRLVADFIGLNGWVRYESASHRGRWIKLFCVLFPLVALGLFVWLPNPRTLVTIGGIAQGATLPVISVATLYLRYRRTDRRIAPSKWWDVCLWLAALSISGVAVYAARAKALELWTQIAEALKG